MTFNTIENLKAYDSATIVPVWADAQGLPSFFFSVLDTTSANVSLQDDGSVIVKNITKDIDVTISTPFR